MKTKKLTGLRRRRVIAGLTMQELADSLRRRRVTPCNVRAIYDWEYGRAPIPEDVAQALRKVLR